jgi:hypothetical protein
VGLSLYSIRWAQLWDSQKLRSICRAELTVVYDEVGDNARQLIELNKHIDSLRATEKTARAALAASSLLLYAPGIAAAQRALQAVDVTKRLLRIRQLSLINSSHLKLWKARQNISAKLKAQSGRLGLVHRRVKINWGLPPRLAVRKADRDQELPKYELKPHFEHQQKMELNWQSQFTSAKEGRWSIAKTESLSIQKTTLPESCGMTLRHTGTKDRPRFLAMPTQDKYFWKR